LKQAVVIIHGIGSQAPGETLRRFVGALVGENYRSKPDRLSEILDVRRFTYHAARQGRIPPTEFYELYWAHRMEEGKLGATLTWIARLLLRPFWRVDRQLRSVFMTAQVALVTTLLLVFVPGLRQVAEGQAGWGETIAAWQAIAVGAFGLLQIVLGGWLTQSVADAARYTSPSPNDVEQQAGIRNEGVRLLRALHEAGTYSRVIVVGHSLGSVIGYDILRQLWDEMRHPDPCRRGRQEIAKDFDDYCTRLLNDEVATRGERAESFQQLQHRLWRENRQRGVPWLVTDFVSLGSPLAHAPLLLHRRSASVQRRIVERELPTCPPTRDEKDGKSFYLGKYVARCDEAQTTASFRVGHHGAVFGPTRWTNLYLPSRWLLAGDPVGGPCAPVFGSGVRDVAVRPSFDGWRRVLRGCFPWAHGCYWLEQTGRDVSRERRRALDRRTGRKDARTALLVALRLDALRSGDSWPEPEPAPALQGGR
jgi:hypothetical protein